MRLSIQQFLTYFEDNIYLDPQFYTRRLTKEGLKLDAPNGFKVLSPGVDQYELFCVFNEKGETR